MDGGLCQNLLLREAINLDSSMTDFAAKVLAQVLNHAFDSRDVGEGSADEGDEAFPWVLTHDSKAMESVYGCPDCFIPIYRGDNMWQIILKSKTVLEKGFSYFFRESLKEYFVSSLRHLYRGFIDCSNPDIIDLFPPKGLSTIQSMVEVEGCSRG
jgi:hypothetical protein